VHGDVLAFLIGLAVLLGSARLLGELCRRFGLPSVAGEIVAGVLIGRTLLGRLSPTAFAWIFPEGPAKTMLSGYTTVAVMLLLVLAGLEIDLSVVKRSGRLVLVTSAFGMVVPFVLGLATGWLLPAGDLPDPSRRGLHAAFLGIALSISALPVIAKTLLDLGLMKTDLGLVILSAAVLNDLTGWMAFSILTQRFEHGEGDVGGLVRPLALTAVFVVGTLLVVRPIADRLIARLQSSDEAASGRVLSMIMVLALLGAAATQALGMHPVFGGFVVGVAIGDSSRLREHTRQILHDFVSYVFTPVFFATMALRHDFAAAFDPALVAVVVAIACIAKIVGCAAGARLMGVGVREAAAIGFGLNSRGAMEILLAVLAMEAGIIHERLFVALVIMAVLTSVISGPALVWLLRPLASPVAALLRAGEVLLDPPHGTREALLATLAGALATRGGRAGDAATFIARVEERERLAGTGVGDGVAFPHAEIPGLAAPLLAFARLERGVDFNAPDGLPVRLVFMLLMPPRDYDRQLQLLSAMARLLTRPETRAGLLHAGSARAVLDVIDGAGRTPGASAASGEAAPRSR
jgi:Kef-type K+ transport system membrane component KefB